MGNKTLYIKLDNVLAMEFTPWFKVMKNEFKGGEKHENGTTQ